ncbi:hypothetical protein WR164_05310 [Philodulcilactobacillus myokoensis]|uniref:Uncharacterized protein n=1 Tax=Philodulcilactobacillus myokoensis TaxID=2929573 RepID=A0A9W6ESJ6_9LACO|nr:hypothetical protein [Philodulcilactobacillus myokoensis]GLB46552.1 hypothetical protein WR164_05310 [Philodulcilactobacillus myokoensis]
MDNSILNDLTLAENSHKLVNVYQIDSGIFYTGYVYKHNYEGVVLKVYDTYGMPNGFVYLRLVIIDQVDFVSNDLLHMQTKITLADRMGLKDSAINQLKLPKDDHLIYQLVGRTYVEDQMLVISLNNQSDYVEGFIESFDQKGLVLTTIDEFNFSHRNQIKIDYNNIRLIELFGKQLVMLRKSKSILFSRHLKTIRYKRIDAIKRHLSRFSDQKYILIMPKSDDGLFFIGRLKVINDYSLILSVIDMSGQFGGYVLMRFTNIGFIEIQSDYLRLMTEFAKLNLKSGKLIQPVLNADRAFDHENNWFIDILNQASMLHRIIRIQLHNGSSQLGYPIRIHQNQFVDFKKLDHHHERLFTPEMLPIDQIEQISFDYLGTLYIQKRLKQNHKL